MVFCLLPSVTINISRHEFGTSIVPTGSCMLLTEKIATADITINHNYKAMGNLLCTSAEDWLFSGQGPQAIKGYSWC